MAQEPDQVGGPEAQHQEHRAVRIHINRKPHESPNPTTGEALYALGAIGLGYQLYREARGDEEDEPVRNGEEQIHLREDEHFYSQEKPEPSFTIVVNGRQKRWAEEEISFAQVVALAFETPPTGPNVIFTVTYLNGGGKRPDGTLVTGNSVRVKNGMIFNVTPTDKS
jgi:Multiubiquitin